MPEWDLNMSTAYKRNRRWVLNRLWLLIIYNSPIAIYNLQKGKKEKEKDFHNISLNLNEHKWKQESPETRKFIGNTIGIYFL